MWINETPADSWRPGFGQTLRWRLLKLQTVFAIFSTKPKKQAAAADHAESLGAVCLKSKQTPPDNVSSARLLCH